jgi:2-keto-3-deoxy-L-fuconate dehydrogenase
MPTPLAGKRIFVTQAAAFMGPALCEALAEQGAEVIADGADPTTPGALEDAVARSPRIDVRVANLALKAPTTPAVDVQDDEWRSVFATLVGPQPSARIVSCAAQ